MSSSCICCIVHTVSQRNQCFSGSSNPFPLNIGNLMFVPTIMLAHDTLGKFFSFFMYWYWTCHIVHMATQRNQCFTGSSKPIPIEYWLLNVCSSHYVGSWYTWEFFLSSWTPLSTIHSVSTIYIYKSTWIHVSRYYEFLYVCGIVGVPYSCSGLGVYVDSFDSSSPLDID